MGSTNEESDPLERLTFLEAQHKLRASGLFDRSLTDGRTSAQMGGIVITFKVSLVPKPSFMAQLKHDLLTLPSPSNPQHMAEISSSFQHQGTLGRAYIFHSALQLICFAAKTTEWVKIK